MYNIIETVDYQPPQLLAVKKQIWNPEKQQFEPRTFMRIRCATRAQFEDSVKWFREQSGEATYQGSWWLGSEKEIWMSDALTTFWILKFQKND